MKMKNKKGLSKTGYMIIVFIIILIIFISYAVWDNYKKAKIVFNPAIITPTPTPTTTILTPNVKINSTIYPNPELTPGNFLTMDTDFLCIPRTVEELAKDTTVETKKQIFENYQLSYPPKKKYQMDRYIPISLGGSNDIRNIWPQSIDYPGYQEKDKAEEYLYNLMCNNTINITTAQERIKTDWIAVFKECCLK